MANDYSVAELLEFLEHAADHGLMPAATAQALMVSSRQVFGILSDAERADLRNADLDGIIKRFSNKRAKEFTPTSLKEYGRRVRRAVELFLQWREDPAGFSVKTRSTVAAKRKDRGPAAENGEPGVSADEQAERVAQQRTGGYQSSFPIRPGRVVTISNIPEDLTESEADRLAKFVKMLAVESPGVS